MGFEVSKSARPYLVADPSRKIIESLDTCQQSAYSTGALRPSFPPLMGRPHGPSDGPSIPFDPIQSLKTSKENQNEVSTDCQRLDPLPTAGILRTPTECVTGIRKALSKKMSLRLTKGTFQHRCRQLLVEWSRRRNSSYPPIHPCKKFSLPRLLEGPTEES